MPNNIIESSSFMTADSLRTTLKMLQNFYNMHTKKNFGYTDISGSQYSGIINNYATELLMETRKILMDKSSLKNFICDSTFDFYFNIQYSDLISTYDQQNLLAAILNNDVFLSNKEYRLSFEDCVEKHILRSESWSDPSVLCDKFYHTNTPPKLIIHNKTDGDNHDNDVIKTLSLSDGTDNPVDYYYFINSTTTKFIDTITSDSLITKPLTNAMSELPFIWINISIFQLLPPIDMSDFIDSNNDELLTIGTDGHNVSRMYPLTYGNNNVPSDVIPIDENWYIKVIPVDGEAFDKNINTSNNYNVKIGSVIYEYITSDMGTVQPIISVKKEFTDEYIKISLSKDDNVMWLFKSPTVGDYDYDGLTYINPVYGYIKLKTFIQNIKCVDSTREPLLSAFIIKFDDEYLNNYEVINGNASTGIHIDTSSEYSDNSIDKKNGMIHGLGDFNGLPRYFSQLADRTVHRSHIELYAIRDDLNNTNQKYTDKQTSALIVDSAMPRKEIDTMLDDLSVMIKYKSKPIIPTIFNDTQTGMYYTDNTIAIVSPQNQLSNIAYVNENTFGDASSPRYKLNKKFIYHGERVFSLDRISLDPELEMARVFYISNDSSSYENNALTNYPKSPRTLCRVCDIPTSFVELVNIIGISPTLIIDSEYVRMCADLSVDNVDMIINKNLVTHIMLRYYENQDASNLALIFPSNINLNNAYPKSKLLDNYNIITNINNSFDLLSETRDYGFDVSIGGSGYEVNDKFSLLIGGTCYRGSVIAVDDGVVTEINININDDNRYINPANINWESTHGMCIYTPTTTSGIGTGLKIILNAYLADDPDLQTKTDTLPNNINALKYDDFNNIFIYNYNTKSDTFKSEYQLTGEKINYNVYDIANKSFYYPRYSIGLRKLNDVIINNMISCNRFYPSSIYSSSDIQSNVMVSEIKTDIELNDTVDLSDKLIGFNHQDAYLALTVSDDDPLSTVYNISIFEQGHIVHMNNNTNISGGSHILPQFNELNLYNYYSKSTMISAAFNNTQPDLSIYSPFRKYNYEILTEVFDEIKLLSKKEITYIDIIYSNGIPDYKTNDTVVPDNNETTEESGISTLADEEGTDDAVDPETLIINPITGKLTRNLYCYNEYNMTDSMSTFLTNLTWLTRDELIVKIKSLYGNYVDPIKFENTEYAYSKQELIDYLIINYHDNPMYKHNGLKLDKNANTKVVSKSVVDNTYTAVGDQPTGTYVSLSSYCYNPYMNCNNDIVVSNIIHVIKIDNFDDVLSSDFCVKDNNGVDISYVTMLIISNGCYIKIQLTNKWIKIK